MDGYVVTDVCTAWQESTTCVQIAKKLDCGVHSAILVCLCPASLLHPKLADRILFVFGALLSYGGS